VPCDVIGAVLRDDGEITFWGLGEGVVPQLRHPRSCESKHGAAQGHVDQLHEERRSNRGTLDAATCRGY
jgi:hypothetical protein